MHCGTSLRRIMISFIGVASLLVATSDAGAQQHEVGHWIGLYYPAESPAHLHLEALLVDVDGPVTVGAGSWFRVDDVSVKILNCLEIATDRDGAEMAYASFATPGSSTPEIFVRTILVDGVSTEADLGYSEVRTSPDLCGAAAVHISKIEAIVFKQKVSA